MELHLQPVFTCISITRKAKLYVAMFHVSLHLLIGVSEACSFRRKKLNMSNKLVTLSFVQIK